MKICNFKDQNKLELKFKTSFSPEKYKESKNSFLENQIPNEKERLLAKERLFKDTTYSVIPIIFNETNKVNEDLMVIDCDNCYTKNLFIDKFKNKTLVTESPYGAHIYFKFDNDEIKIFKNQIVEPHSKVSEDKVKNAIESKGLKLEIYSRYHKKGIIFDGANNPYYKIVSNVTEPTLITKDSIEELKTLFQLKDNISHYYNNGDEKLKWVPDEEKSEFLKESLKGDFDPYIFWQLYNGDDYEGLKYTQTDALNNRNNFLKSVYGTWGVTGFIESAQDLTDFIMIVAEEILGLNLDEKEPGSIYQNYREEYEKTICRGKEFEDGTFILKKDSEKLLKRIEKQKRMAIDPFRHPVFIARNLDMSASTNKYLLINLENRKRPVISRLCNKDAIEGAMVEYPSLVKLHMRPVKVETKEGEPPRFKMMFLEKTLPYIRITECEEPEYEKDLLIKKGDTYILNLKYFSYNPNINKVLEEDYGMDKDQIVKDFENTIFYQVVSRNHIPDPKIRKHFFAQIKDYLYNRCYQSTMLIIKDVLGSTGKDSILSPALNQMFFGDEVIFSSSPETSYVPTYMQNSTVLSAKEIIEDNFNAFATSSLLVINEDGGNINHYHLNTQLQSILKNDMISLRVMHKERQKIRNKLFIVRYTNSTKELIKDDETNTRFYVSNAQRDITKAEWDKLLEGYEHLPPILAGKEIAKKEEIALLRYFLLIPNDADPRKLPETEETILEEEDLIDVIKENPRDNPGATTKKIIKDYIKYGQDLNKIGKGFEKEKDDQSWNYYLFRLLATLHSKAKNPNDYDVKAEETFKIKDLKGGRISLKIVRNRYRFNEFKVAYRQVFDQKCPQFLEDYITQQLSNRPGDRYAKLTLKE